MEIFPIRFEEDLNRSKSATFLRRAINLKCTNHRNNALDAV